MAIYRNSSYSNNNTDLYKKVRDERGVKNIYQFRTKLFNKIDKASVETFSYIWKKGDNLFKSANRFYGNKDYWWLIAHFNEKPTDAHFEIGEEIFIPSTEIFGEL